MKRQAIFLDRDGVLNHAVMRDDRPQSPRNLDDLDIIHTAITACTMLRDAGFILIGVTNQPDIRRGKVTKEIVEQINLEISQTMGLDAIYYCSHDDADGCACRKPKPGMLLDGAKEFHIDLAASIMVGDRGKDIDAGLAAGCKTVFIDLGHVKQQPAGAHYVCTSLLEGVSWILDKRREE